MKINIFLNFFKGIAGGYKVVYQYANYLSQKKYDVCIYYELNNGYNSRKIPKLIMIVLRKIYLKKYPYYFKLNKNIKQKGIKTICDKYVRNADIGIFTSPIIVEKSKRLSREKGKKINFVQAYENWWNTDKEIKDSYKECDLNIVISNWLLDIVRKNSNKEVVLVRNGIDLSLFKNKQKIRKLHSISMIYHEDEIKGCKYGLEALSVLKKEYPDLEANLFGFPKRPDNLPVWINYTESANEEQVVNIMNNSTLFLCTSLHEGFGLPGLESLACGCILITTDCFGPLEYANEKNSIICKKEDVDSIVCSVKEVFENDEFREKLLKNAKKTVLKWDIKNSMLEFEKNLIKK